MSVSIDRLPALGGDGRRLRHGRGDLMADAKMLLAGKMDLGSLLSGHRLVKNPVEVVVRDGAMLERLGYNAALREAGFRAGIDNINVEPFRTIINDKKWDRAIREVRRTHNLRVTMGRDDWQRLGMFGDITANSSSYTGVTGTASSAPTATTLTNSGAAFPTSGGINGSLQGHIVVCPVAGVYGVILSNSGTVLTVDQWTAFNSATGAAGTTPSNGAAYAILPWSGIAAWVGLSTSAAAPAAGDVTRTADGLYGDGTTSGTATEQNTNGLSRAFQQWTIISGGMQWQYTWTYTGSSPVVIAKGVLFNSLAAAGTLLILETLLSSTATVNSNGDTLQLTWQVTL
jgi:hypothetical protein